MYPQQIPPSVDRLNEFGYNFIIDELFLFLQEGDNVESVRLHGLVEDHVEVVYRLRSGESYFSSIPAGWFRETWEDASNVLQTFYTEMQLEPLLALSPDFCRSLEPAELERRVRQAQCHQWEIERDHLRRLEQGREAFRRQEYESVVQLFGEVEERLTGSDVLKLKYSRAHRT